MRCNPPPFTAIYAILDAIGFNQFTLTVSNPVRTLFSANWSFRFHYGVFFRNRYTRGRNAERVGNWEQLETLTGGAEARVCKEGGKCGEEAQ
jgi:hypothetical protein